MTLSTLLRDARRDCATLTRGHRFDRWLRVWRPAAMVLHRKEGLFQGNHLNAWLKITDRLLTACRIEPEAAEEKKQSKQRPAARKVLARTQASPLPARDKVRPIESTVATVIADSAGDCKAGALPARSISKEAQRKLDAAWEAVEKIHNK